MPLVENCIPEVESESSFNGNYETVKFMMGGQPADPPPIIMVMVMFCVMVSQPSYFSVGLI